MTPEQIQELLDRIFSIGGALASKGFDLAVRQVYVEIVFYLGWIVVGIVLLHLAGRMVRWLRSGECDASDEVLTWVALAVVLVGGVFVVLSSGTAILAHLINPQWYAVKLLLSAAGLGS